jgi:hypothetical protein
MKSGVLGSPDQRTTDSALRADGITSQDGFEGTQRYVMRLPSRMILPRHLHLTNAAQ